MPREGIARAFLRPFRRQLLIQSLGLGVVFFLGHVWPVFRVEIFALGLLGFFFFSLWSIQRLLEPLVQLLGSAADWGQSFQEEGAAQVAPETSLSDGGNQRPLLGPGTPSDRGSGVGRKSEGRLEDEDWDHLITQAKADLEHKAEQMERDRGELSTLMGALSDGILAVDLEGAPLFFNSRFAVLFMASSGEAASSGRTPPRLQDLFDDSELLLAYARALSGEHPTPTPIRRHSEGGVPDRYFSVSVAPLKREGGQVYGAVGVFHDISELKQAEQIRIDFVANVSHELRTPLTSIKGYTDTLLEDAKSARWESFPRFLGVISRNVDRLMSLIQDLLDLSWLESGGELQFSEIEIRELTQRVVGQLESLRIAKGHEIDVQVGVSTLHGDARRVEQVLVNLLENAIKYVPAGGGKISVRWEAEEQKVLLRIKDNGPGIPPAHQARLFERFYRVDKARSRELGGTGLGLAIVKHILQAHGGSVNAHSEVGAGSEFVCEFPIHRREIAT